MKTHIVVVGGVAGGMSAATRARRMNESASIVVLEKGGFISFANCGLPYYLAGRIEDEQSLLVTTPQQVKSRFNIDVRVKNEVLSIDRERKQLEVIEHNSGRKYRENYDKLILAPGATAIIPPIDHVRAANVFLLRSMEDTQAVHSWLSNHSPTRVVVVGAGFIGLEMAEAMRERGLSVTVVEKAPHVLPPVDAEMSAAVADELEKHAVRVIVGNGLKSLRVDGDQLVNGVEIETGEILPADMVLLSIGVRPNVSLASNAGLTIGSSGAIAVDEFQRTSDPDIYAVGDAAEVVHAVMNAPTRIPLAGPANRTGRLAGEHAATGAAPTASRVLGTAIVQVFDLSIGMTGLSEDAARRAGIACDTAYVLPSHHAGYYPGARTLQMKLIYAPDTGRVLGAQVVGEEGVDKRIDVIATAIHFRATVDDLAGLDLAYAPQFGSAKDPVHLLAMVAQNQRRGLARGMRLDESADGVLLDVRSPEEFARGTLRGAINVPLDELRTRVSELDPRRKTIAFCQVGQRGYIVQRMLQQMGFDDVHNLKGGYTMAKATRKALAQTA